jgi:hypothetical protein
MHPTMPPAGSVRGSDTVAVMRAVLANKALVPVNTEARVTYALSRLSPALLGRLLRGADTGLKRLGNREAAEAAARHRRT